MSTVDKVLTGATTHFTDTNVRIAHDADGLTMDFTIGELGPELTAVETGVFVPEKDGGDNTVSDGGESPDWQHPESRYRRGRKNRGGGRCCCWGRRAASFSPARRPESRKIGELL